MSITNEEEVLVEIEPDQEGTQEDVGDVVEESPQEDSVLDDIIKRNQELQARVSQLEVPQDNQSQQMGEKPTIAGCNYDVDLYDKKIEEWVDSKLKKEYEQKRKKETLETEWSRKISKYTEQKAKLGATDYGNTEAIITAVLNQQQQSLILESSENAAKVVYVLGKNPKKLKELAAIQNPIHFAIAVTRLEEGMKREDKKSPPAIDEPVKASGSSGSVAANLERLRAQAEKSGDYTKVIEFKRKNKDKVRSL